MPRTIAIGDIHGCLDEFRELIGRVGPVEGDRVVCLGDFMDKGPFAAECVAFARQNGFESIMGNHEEKHLRWRKHEDTRAAALAADPKRQVKKNPMRPLREQDQAANRRLTEEDVAWLSSLPTTIELMPGWVAVHGGFDPAKTIPDQDPSTVMRARWFSAEGKHVALDYDKPETLKGPPPGGYHWTDRWPGPESVVFGHEAFDLNAPLVVDRGSHQCWGIDTGCVHGGHLTALILPTFEVVQVRARRVYEPRHHPSASNPQ